MLKPRGKQTKFIYGEDVYKIIPEDDFYKRLDKETDFSIIRKRVEYLYSHTGQPALCPERMFKAELVQYFEDLSDREMEREARFNIRIKSFLGMNIDDYSFDHSSLNDFRERLGEELHKELFNELLEQIFGKGITSKKERGYLDAAHVIADIAIPTTIQLVNQSVKKLLNLIKRKDKIIYQALGFDVKNINDKQIEYKIDNSEKRKRLVKAVRLAHEVLNKISKYLNEFSDSNRPLIEKQISILKRILNENIEIKKKKIEEKEEKPGDRLVSTHDPDARRSAKSNKKPFTGYKVNIIKNKSGFITNMDTRRGNIQDNIEAAKPVKEQKLEHEISPPEIGADTLFGSGENRRTFQAYGIKLVAPLPKKSKTEFYSNEEFEYDEENHSLKCPTGNVTEKFIFDKRGYTFSFGKNTCNECPLRKQCTKNKNGRKVFITQYYEEIQEAKEFNQTDEYKEIMNGRKGIEPKIAEMKRFHGMTRAKFRGLKRFSIQVWLTGIVVNLKRMITLLYPKVARAPS